VAPEILLAVAGADPGNAAIRHQDGDTDLESMRASVKAASR
jgi:hypothetical protein